ncbi:MAG: FAD-binding oxidoreductase [Ornithinimicrobium sp.]
MSAGTSPEYSGPRVAVVGAGIVGLCTAYTLVLRGIDVTVYEQGVPGNSQSGGVSRIFRHAHDDPRLIGAAMEARALYEQWGRNLGVDMVSADGAVALGPDVPARLRRMQQAGVRAREIEADTLTELIPVLAHYDGPAMLDEDGGSIRTSATIAALVQALGDRLLHEEVISLRLTGDSGDRVELRSGGTTEVFDTIVVAAGRGTPHLVRGVGLSLPISHGAHVRLTFRVRGDPPTRLATLQDSSGDFGEKGVYAAAVPGNSAYGLGLSDKTAVREDGSVADPGALKRLADRAQAYVTRALPGLDPDPVDVRHCWVTELPWGPDGMAVWRNGSVLVPVGHNLFKQAPSLGRKLADAVCGAELDQSLMPGSRLGGAE